VPILRADEERFEGIPDFPYSPNYVAVPGPDQDQLRMHFVDEGPREAPPVLLLHGQPTWSYLWRHVIAGLLERGHRVVAPDHIGFGRSDKVTERTDYTFVRHIEWMHCLVRELDLGNITLVVQDWGGPIGLSVLAADPDRFTRVLATNTILHTCEPLGDEVAWVNAPIGDHQVVHEAGLLDYILLTQRAPGLDASLFVRFGSHSTPPPEVLAAYDAPFPDERHKAGMRQFPVLIPLTPNDEGAVIGRSTWEALGQWHKPFLTAFSDQDPATRGWDRVFQRRVPGAQDQPHVTLHGAGHFVPEDRGDELAGVIDTFVRS
jgi:haloalkane dehalogenase